MGRQTTLKGNPFDLQGDELSAGDAAPAFSLTGTDLSPVTLRGHQRRACLQRGSVPRHAGV